MCIPHGATGKQSISYKISDKPKKHVTRVPKDEFENGDPNFKDERIINYAPKQRKKSLIELLFK